MATKAQTTANRQNSQKSTGPRTAEGKAAVSQNAVKHGLFADEAVINGEDQADFDLHRDAFLAELRPVGVMESMLAGADCQSVMEAPTRRADAEPSYRRDDREESSQK